MITATEARLNAANFQLDRYNRVYTLVEKVIPELDECVQLHSKNGHSEATVRPYEESHFPFIDQCLASEMIGRILTQNGYEVVTNDYKKNVLKFKW